MHATPEQKRAQLSEYYTRNHNDIFARDTPITIGNIDFSIGDGERTFIVLRKVTNQIEPEPDYKFHINVNDSDTARAWGIVAQVCGSHGLSGTKVYRTRDQDLEQGKKMITLYSRETISDAKMLEVLNDVQRELTASGIPPLPLPSCDGRIDLGAGVTPFISFRREDKARKTHFIPSNRFQGIYTPNNVPDIEYGRLPIHYLAENGDANMLHRLLQDPSQRSHIDTLDGNGQTPLHLAMQKNQLVCVKLLLAHGANKDIPDPVSETPPSPQILSVLQEGADLSVTPAERAPPPSFEPIVKDTSILTSGFLRMPNFKKLAASSAAVAAISSETPEFRSAPAASSPVSSPLSVPETPRHSIPSASASSTLPLETPRGGARSSSSELPSSAPRLSVPETPRRPLPPSQTASSVEAQSAHAATSAEATRAFPKQPTAPYPGGAAAAKLAPPPQPSDTPSSAATPKLNPTEKK